MTDTIKGEIVLTFATPAAFEKWLAKNHETASGLWLKLPKAGSGERSVTRGEALDRCLAYGWIDATARSIDETWWVQRFNARRPRSKWSKINVAKVEALIAEGKMKPSGLREVERARADGRWDAAYASPKNATVPDDLAAALDASPQARAFFATLKGQNRYAILYRIADARKPETRARRIAQFVAMLAEGKTVY